MFTQQTCARAENKCNYVKQCTTTL
uniref:Uncharacterized protein n=1 Tax=Anguilla anguilla TaxID=7936 RepID=A0A0E9XBP6_ANGAN